jgi:predicted ATP-grasp superfamily ATP-dependent carboligase
MDETRHVLLFGASVRALANSALRAGLAPWCADLFADEDLRAKLPATRVASSDYPRAFLDHVRTEVAGPWMYSGALENWPALLHDMARARPLWGNDQHVLARARSPYFVSALLEAAAIPCPKVAARPEGLRGSRRWLLKPLRGSSGTGIRFHSNPAALLGFKHAFFQEYIEGEPYAAIYAGDGYRATLLGVTRQLIGEDWLHAGPFRYCGSIGAIPLPDVERAAFERLGNALAEGCGLCGLFGVDAVRRDGAPWPVEINPRYTASIEVLEFARNFPALEWHRRVFDSTCKQPLPPSPSPSYVGKAILFARQALTFPANGPWVPSLEQARQATELPAYADIPRAGEAIQAGAPIITFFCCGASIDECRDSLRQTAVTLDQLLFGR